MEKVSPHKKPASLQHNPDRSRALLLALSRAAQVIQKTSQPEEMCRLVGEQIKQIGYEVTLLMVSEDRHSLTAVYTSYASELLRQVEKLSGFQIQNYRIVFPPESIYARNLASGKTEYVNWALEHITEALPKNLHPVAGQFMKILNIEQGILAPLHAEGETLGLMMVSGLSLSAEDVPVIESFACQIATGIQNATLMKKLQAELAARKQAEEAARQTERRFQALIENAPDGITLVGPDGKTSYTSPSARNMFGFGADEAILANPLDFIHPDDLGAVLSAMNDLIQDPAVTPSLQYRFMNKDGSYRWVESTFSNLLAEPAVQAVVINFRDITARKNTEHALRESEKKFHSVVAESEDGIALTDESGRIIEFNHGFEQIIGQKREAVLGQFLWDLLSSTTPPPLRSEAHYTRTKTAILKALETGESANFHNVMEMPFHHQDGSQRFIQQRLFSIRTETGWRLGNISRDITERKKAEEALRASEENSKSLYQLIRMMTDNLPDLVWAKDMNGCYSFTNKAMAEKLLVAEDTDEAVGRTDMFFAERQRAAHPDNPNWHTFGELCANTDKVVHASRHAERFEEFGNVRGEFLFLDVYKAPFWDKQGEMIGTVGVGRDVTHERKLEEENRKAQKALAASEAELRALFASMQDAVLVIDRDGVYREIAPTNPTKYYITPQELLGKNLLDIFPAEKAQAFISVIRQVLDTQETSHIEYELPVNGQCPWFEAFISPMGPDRTLWVARDISERKQAEAKLHLQSAALEAAANAIVITDRQGLIQWTNSAFSKLTGYQFEDAIGQNPGRLVKSGRQNDQFYETLWATILAGETWHDEIINRQKNGSLYTEEMTITPLFNGQGEISHFIAVKQDITKRKQAEAALIQSEQNYRTLFENMPIGQYRTTVDGQLLDANPAFVNMFGYPDREALLAQKARNLYADPLSETKFRNEIKLVGTLSGYEAQFRRFDESIFWAEDYVRTVFDAQGVPIYFEGSLIDITERKQAEAELRHTKESLETAHNELQQMFAHEQVLARTDGLTGLTNRRHFFDLATREFNLSMRYNHALSIILFDVDGFKQVNDTLGHAVGDLVLMQVAQVTNAQVRQVDILARYGGDEFIILLPQTNARQAFQIAERIRRKIAGIKIQELEQAQVTLSIGIAEVLHAQPEKSVDAIILQADKGLYQAKQNGKNNTVIFTKGD